MSKRKQLQKVKQNYQVINQSEHIPNSLVKVNLNSVEVQALVAEEQKLLDTLKTQTRPLNQQPNTVDNLSTVLVQSLTTKDQQLISFTLANDDEQLIKNTIQGLPPSKVNQLLESIQQAILSKPYNTHFYSKWLKHLLTIHTTSLLNKANTQIIKNLKGILSSRTRSIHQLSRLKGKLSIVVQQNKKIKQAQIKLPKKVIKQTDQDELQQQLDQIDEDMDIEQLDDLEDEM